MRFRASFPVLVAFLGLSGASGSALAQNQAYCDRLRSEIAAVDTALTGTPASETLAALRKAERDRERTIAFSKSLGCDDVRIPLLSGPVPSQCPALKSQVKQLDATIAGLRDEAARGMNSADLPRRKAELTKAFETICIGVAPPQSAGGFAPPADIPSKTSDPVASGQAPQPVPSQATKPVQKQVAAKPVPSGLFESLFGFSFDDAGESEMPDGPLGDMGVDSAGGSRTICVRTCDGFYFPINGYASQSRLQLDQDICRASCPTAETRLFVQGVEANVDTATAVDDGTPYTALPNAFKYRTAIDATCACRLQGKTWAETLTEAERILGVNGQSDAQISELKAQELSRPKEIRANRNKKNDPKAKTPDAGQSASMPDTAMASFTPSAIPAGTTVVPVGEGEFREITTPDGTKRRIRILRVPGAAPITSTEQD